MKRYLAHLLADLETAARLAPESSSYVFRSPFSDDDDDTRTDGLYVRFVRLSDLFNLPPDAFPPVDRLTKAQVTDVLKALESLWRAWRISWECPSRVTARRRYTLMVEWMYRETVRYHHDFGAEIDFCCHRAQGICPLGDTDNCFCKEVEDTAQFEVESWEEYHRQQMEETQSTPVQEFYEWLRQDEEPSEFDWDYDEERDRWRKFAVEEDLMAWLYFYRPDMTAEPQGDEPEPSPEDFDDFEWDDFQGGYRDDDFPLPF
ncbi:MAG: hypothetical protein KF734_09025 [Saprospiraceae bacterium]|nr:hypothetical protein [Saprospiraceae bacterium]